MDSVPPIIGAPKAVRRGGWWIHLVLITGYILVAMGTSLMRAPSHRPALTHTPGGMLIVCAEQMAVFAIICAVAWRMSRATRDDLLLRWRGNVLPPLLGAGYSIGLRIAIGIIYGIAAGILVAAHAMSASSLQGLADKTRSGIELLVDIDAMRNNPAYYWLTLTLVSFVVAGLREEIWRTSFLAGLRALWPAQFATRRGEYYAVIVAAVFFGMGHLAMGVMAAIMAGLLGLGLGIIMVAHRSIWPAVFAHGFFDAASLALLPYAQDLISRLPAH